jgi:TP53 regulating kinase and related kinases
VVLGCWEGLPAVFKVRVPLPYRLPVLDEAIRHQRTVREAQMIHAARSAGVQSPHIYDVDLAAATLVLEHISGQRLKDLIPHLDGRRTSRLLSRLGSVAASLHKGGIMHGDLTTANVIVRDGDLVLLDFGLALHSDRVEDHAVDLRLIKETLTGAHPTIARAGMRSLLEGYAAVAGPARGRAVQRQVRSIERRGRYARVV